MQRRSFLILAAAAALAAQPAFAKDLADRVVDQLRGQGFSSIQIERTLLGRTRILAERGDGRREIILNPRTGEILRDLWIASAGGSAANGLIRDDSGSRTSGDDDGGKGRGRGRGGDDDDGDDGDDDSGDDDDDDRSDGDSDDDSDSDAGDSDSDDSDDSDSDSDGGDSDDD